VTYSSLIIAVYILNRYHHKETSINNHSLIWSWLKFQPKFDLFEPYINTLRCIEYGYFSWEDHNGPYPQLRHK